MRELLGFRHAHLGAASIGHHLPQHVVRRGALEQDIHERRQRVGVVRHSGGGSEANDPSARETVERRIQKRRQNLPDPVRSEVETQDGIAVLHALVVADDRGRDEFIEFAIGIGRLDRGVGGGEARPGGMGHRSVGLADSFPALVAIEGEVAANNRCDGHIRRQIGAQLTQIVARRLRRRVAPVGERMHRGRHPGGAQPAREGNRDILMRMDAARRGQPHQMASASGRFQRRNQLLERRQFGPRAVLGRVGDQAQPLRHDTPRSDVLVAGFGIPHLAGGQADIAAGCVE